LSDAQGIAMNKDAPKSPAISRQLLEGFNVTPRPEAKTKMKGIDW
jgi:hypothetical protein